MIFQSNSQVLKTRTLNVSEGGALIGPLEKFSMNQSIPLMLSIPQYPSLNNYTLQKLKEFAIELFPQKVIRVKAQAVREIPIGNNDNLYGLSFSSIDKHDQKIIDNYVQTFLSNIVHLISLIDMVNYDEEALHMVKELSTILGYPYDSKLSTLRNLVMHDYKSLQWL